jgi:hypothetical protein
MPMTDASTPLPLSRADRSQWQAEAEKRLGPERWRYPNQEAWVFEAILVLLSALPQWQSIETAPVGKSVLIRVPLDNGPEPKMTTVRGFYAEAGTIEMDTDEDDYVTEDGTNALAAWFEESAEREPYAMMLTYTPTHWMPLPEKPEAPRV